MWGGQGGGQPQNWAFSTQQHAQVASEQEKWAALAHQWIQMKTSGAGLEQTLQPPLPVSASATTSSNSNGTVNSHHDHHNESMDYVGEAPMDLDDSVSHQNNLIRQPQSSSAAQLGLLGSSPQSLYTPDLITQIPPNPVISFSSMSATMGMGLLHQQQIHQNQSARIIPPLMEQPFHQIQPAPSQRLLHPSYLDQAQAPQPLMPSYPSPSQGQSQGTSKKRRSSKHKHDAEPAPAIFHNQHDNNYGYGYSTETTDADVFEGIPRRSLPSWIREGLEKVEQEKRRMEQKEREAELKQQHQAEKLNHGDDGDRQQSDEDDSRGAFNHQPGYEMPKPYIHPSLVPEQQAPLISALSKRGLTGEPVQQPSRLRRPKSPTMEELMEGMSEDEKQELAMAVVRRQLTLILLDVTTEEMRQVATDCIAHAKQKQKVSSVTAVQVRKTSALASLISGGPLGLGGYETDSGSEDDVDGGANRRPSNEGTREQSESEEESENDSEAELIEEMERKRLNFELKENEFTHSSFRRAENRKEKTKAKSPTPEMPAPKQETPHTHTKSPVVSHFTAVPPPVPMSHVPAVTKPPEMAKSPPENVDRRNSSASERSYHSQSHESVRKSSISSNSKRSKSPERRRRSRSRSRSRDRKKDDRSRRRSKSRSRSKERKRRTKSKSRSRERERDRERKSRSRSRDRKHRDRKRSKSRSRSKDRDRKKRRRSRSKSRSPSGSHRRSHRSRSSSSSSRRKHDKEKSKKKGHRSRTRSKEKSSKSKSGHRSKSSKSPAASK